MSEMTDNAARSRFELDIGGQVVFADYQRAPGRLVINWVEAPPALRGTGASGRLMAMVAQQARSEGLTITPVCGYAAAWLRRSPEFRDLVA